MKEEVSGSVALAMTASSGLLRNRDFAEAVGAPLTGVATCLGWDGTHVPGVVAVGGLAGLLAHCDCTEGSARVNFADSFGNQRATEHQSDALIRLPRLENRNARPDNSSGLSIENSTREHRRSVRNRAPERIDHICRSLLG